MRGIGIAVCLLLSTINAWSDEIFLVSGAEQQYQAGFESAVYEGMIQKGLLEAAIKEKGLTLTEADLLLREIARLSSVCNILGIRLYEDEFKNRIGQLISDGSIVTEIQGGVEDFLRDQVRSGEVPESESFGPISKGLEFSKACLRAVQESGIPSLTSQVKTLDIPNGYALDAESGKIYYQGEAVYQVPLESYWRFSCLSRKEGTVGVSGSQRIIPTMCEYDRSVYYGDAIKYATWVPPQNNSVSFVLSDGPGGSTATIHYKIVTLVEGAVVSESEPFLSGEYFRALITDQCFALFNEYTPSEYAPLAGECGDIERLIRVN